MSELEQAPVVEQGIIDEKELTRANAILQEYRDGKKPIDQRIEEAERWWLLKQWEVYDKNAKGAQAGARTTAEQRQHGCLTPLWALKRMLWKPTPNPLSCRVSRATRNRPRCFPRFCR